MPADAPARLDREGRAALAMLAKRNVRYGTRHAAMSGLRALGLAEARATGKGPPGAWVWAITPKGRAAASMLGTAAHA